VSPPESVFSANASFKKTLRSPFNGTGKFQSGPESGVFGQRFLEQNLPVPFYSNRSLQRALGIRHVGKSSDVWCLGGFPQGRTKRFCRNLRRCWPPKQNQAIRTF